MRKLKVRAINSFSGNHIAGQSWELNLNSAPVSSTVYFLYTTLESGFLWQ